MSRPRILLGDDHTLVLDGFRKLLEDRCEIVGVAEDGRTLLRMAQELEPDIVTLDISMPQLNGVDAARKLKKILPRTHLIFVTMHDDPAYVNEAFKAGASTTHTAGRVRSGSCKARRIRAPTPRTGRSTSSAWPGSSPATLAWTSAATCGWSRKKKSPNLPAEPQGPPVRIKPCHGRPYL